MSETTEPFNLHNFARELSLWSCETFGPVDGPHDVWGVIDHMRKELLEIEEDPGEVEEWADLLMLAMDGAMRAGHTPVEITEALVAKLRKNKGRNWPDWRTAPPGKAIEHLKEQA